VDQSVSPDALVARPAIPATDVLEVVSLIWGPRKRRNLADPDLGGAPWSATISIYEGLVEDALARARRGGFHKRELIAFRRIIDQCFRNASEAPGFYAVPLYASERYLADAIGALRTHQVKGVNRKPTFARGEREHVLPLSIHASGTEILADPERYLPQARRAVVGPVCRVRKDEHDAMKRKTSPDPEHPFLRYAAAGVVAYRTMDGGRIDPAAWSYEDHLDYMETQPAYATGAALLRSAGIVRLPGTSQPR
jgi:hypothetical protein